MCDLDGDSRLNYHEFITAAYDHKSLLTSDNIAKVFSLLDQDNDGFIDQEDLLVALPTEPKGSPRKPIKDPHSGDAESPTE